MGNPNQDADEIVIEGGGDLCSRDLIQDCLEGKLDDGALVTYLFVASSIMQRKDCANWKLVAERRGIHVATLMSHLDALVDLGWAEWDATDECNHISLHGKRGGSECVLSTIMSRRGSA